MNRTALEKVLNTDGFTGSWAGVITDPDETTRHVQSATVYHDQQFGEERCIGQQGTEDRWQAFQVTLAGDTPSGLLSLGDGKLLGMYYKPFESPDSEPAEEGSAVFSRGSNGLLSLTGVTFKSAKGRRVDCNLIIEGQAD